jgi:hypothetical protein
MLVGFAPSAAFGVVATKNTTFPGTLNGVATVSTGADFVKAAADSAVTKIVLAEDITFDDFQRFERKTASGLVIDGAGGVGRYGRPFRLAVTKSAAWDCPADPTGYVSLEFRNFKSVTFQNLTLYGEAFNGFAYSQKAIDFTFDRVSFDGPALAIVKNCLKSYGYAHVTIKDSDINLRGRNPKLKTDLCYLYPSEAVEIGFGDVILDGAVNITKTPTALKRDLDLDHDEIFYFREKEGNVIVKPGASVNILNKSDALKSCYWSGLIYKGCCLADLGLIIGEGATFNFETDGGIVTENGIKRFDVASGADVSFLVNVPHNKAGRASLAACDNGSYFRSENINVAPGAKVDFVVRGDTLYAAEAVVGVNSLSVGEDATFRVVSPDNTVGNTVLRLHGSKPSIYFDRPEEVLLYNGNKTATKKSTIVALAAAGACEGGDCALKDIDFTFVGSGVRTWPNTANVVQILDYSAWTLDLSGSKVWTTGTRSKAFTLKAGINKTNGNLVKPTVDNVADLLAFGSPSPADPSQGILTFGDKSVVQFNGSAAPRPRKIYIEYANVVNSRDIDGWESLKETVVVEGDGVAPVVYNFDLDKYAYTGRDFRFNLYDNPNRRPDGPPVGTMECLEARPDYLNPETGDPRVTVALDEAARVGTLTIYPYKGAYPGEDSAAPLQLWYALWTDDVKPWYWYSETE